MEINQSQCHLSDSGDCKTLISSDSEVTNLRACQLLAISALCDLMVCPVKILASSMGYCVTPRCRKTCRRRFCSRDAFNIRPSDCPFGQASSQGRHPHPTPHFA